MLDALLVGAGVLCSVRLHQHGTRNSCLVAGRQYAAASVAVAAVLARRRECRLPVARSAAVLALVLSTPIAVLDREAFLSGWEFERAGYAAGHDRMEGDAVRVYLDLLVSAATTAGLSRLPWSSANDGRLGSSSSKAYDCSVAFGWAGLASTTQTMCRSGSGQYQIRPPAVTSYCHCSRSRPWISRVPSVPRRRLCREGFCGVHGRSVRTTQASQVFE
ncbi:hypothetical protein [Actinophytocola xinjiangensis]|uniref:hypothetical protein n=1 Tax=Actinophytocola xinjiangensis TaxID=485602 RepID=UPI000B315EB1|nr:hypothetical protein [Actinophytocola xinjiangensis]